METIGEHQLWTFLDGATKPEVARSTEIRKSAGHPVDDYMELASKVAELQFRNRDYVLIYRGQPRDHKNDKGNTSLKPSLFRPCKGRNPDQAMLEQRFATLTRAEQLLVQRYATGSFLGRERVTRQRILRWAILQHYEVCKTPLLDVTHSLRIAASFASDGATNEAYLFVLGVPNLSGAVTASAEAGIQILRLSSVCPPAAVRPHIQEGYLLGEYPEMTGYDQKQHFQHFEIDFGRRLIAKFRFDPRTFWKRGAFSKIGRNALYPNGTDPLFDLSQSLGQSLKAR